MMQDHVQTDGRLIKPDWSAGRRAFLRNCGLAAAGAAALNLTGGAAPAAAAAVTDADVLNFALNLEYLEAEFYLRAVSGKGLEDGDVGGTGAAGPVVGGKKVKFDSKAIKLYAEEIAGDELAHVRFLRAGLGDGAVARPKINLTKSFEAAALAAGLISEGQKFDAFGNETNFLLASFIFEDVGVTAYKGAAPLLTNKAFLEAAAGILAVEAYHAGIIRTLLYQQGLFKEAKAISGARDSLDGDSDLDQGIGDKKKANLVPTDDNGVAFSRSVPQVKSIVFLGGDGKGGFFPNGINGAFA
ncbi:ferritin-like domain-containing protein [Methylopila sp. M107]|uniref:ferritin-like domain-containing protein n=1 Tax=Methylopila sp. M107 TaxID=1101190 RepID=UPI001FD9F5AC|nr:ferritin-like domain-containing protein [Methylopila sp. M107]